MTKKQGGFVQTHISVKFKAVLKNIKNGLCAYVTIRIIFTTLQNSRVDFLELS